MSNKITESQYAAAIPSFCGMGTTIEQHLDAMLCWTLNERLKSGKPMDCAGCPENLSLSENDRQAIWQQINLNIENK